MSDKNPYYEAVIKVLGEGLAKAIREGLAEGVVAKPVYKPSSSYERNPITSLTIFHLQEAFEGRHAYGTGSRGCEKCQILRDIYGGRVWR